MQSFDKGRAVVDLAAYVSHPLVEKAQISALQAYVSHPLVDDVQIPALPELVDEGIRPRSICAGAPAER